MEIYTRIESSLTMKLPETDTAQPEYETQLRKIPLDALTAGVANVRTSPGDVSDLAQSIKTKGLEHPILIRSAPNNPGMFEVIAGSRRVAAARGTGNEADRRTGGECR